MIPGMVLTASTIGGVHGSAGSLWAGSLAILVGVVALVFHRNVYQTFSGTTPNRNKGVGYLLTYFVAPSVLVAIGGVMVLGVAVGHCALFC
jgi:hypothetical protein